MSKLVVNPTQHVLYCHAENGEWLGAEELRSLRPRPTVNDVDVYLSECSDIPCETGSYLPIAGLCAIPPCTSWRVSRDGYHFEANLESFEARPVTLDSSLRYVRMLLSRKAHGDLLGVELSGGLDTSIIIELLKRWRIPFALVGMANDRYEFRTEREVQLFYATCCPVVRLYSGKNIPAFDRLDEVPPHPFPTMGSLNFAHAKQKAEMCREFGVTTLLSGDAGDRLLSFPTPQWNLSGRTPSNWAYWNLAQTIWADQYVFLPRGIQFISGFAIGRIPTLILQLREGLGEDRMKIWARRNFKSYLPEILSDYAYKAFHDGWIVDSLIYAHQTILKMAAFVYDIIPHPEIAPKKIEELLLDFRNFDPSKQNQLLLRLSFLTWVYSNHRK